jgi:predicted transcriptional regulator
MMRENIQECEARIFLEKLLTEVPPRLSPDLARRIQDVLDERTRWHRVQLLERAPETFIAWPYTNWQARTAALYAAAAEAAKAVAGK